LEDGFSQQWSQMVCQEEEINADKSEESTHNLENDVKTHSKTIEINSQED
jgi:hypothetical protein